MGVVLRGEVLRDLVVRLEPGEWYPRFGVLADSPRIVRLVDVDRIHTRPAPDGKHREIWVSAHKPECEDRPGHPPVPRRVRRSGRRRACSRRPGGRAVSRQDEPLNPAVVAWAVRQTIAAHVDERRCPQCTPDGCRQLDWASDSPAAGSRRVSAVPLLLAGARPA